MKLKKLECPYCGGEINIEQNMNKCFCLHCGRQIFVDDGIARSEKNVNINKTVHIINENRKYDNREEELTKRERAALDAQIVRIKEENRGPLRFMIVWGILMLVFLAVSMYFVKQEQRYKDNGGLLVPAKSSDYKGENYKTVENELEKIGFTNIKLNPNYELVLSFDPKKDKVMRVSVDGDSNYSTSEYFLPDTPIIITYYALASDKPNESTPIEDAKPATPDESSKEPATHEKTSEPEIAASSPAPTALSQSKKPDQSAKDNIITNLKYYEPNTDEDYEVNDYIVIDGYNHTFYVMVIQNNTGEDVLVKGDAAAYDAEGNMIDTAMIGNLIVGPHEKQSTYSYFGDTKVVTVEPYISYSRPKVSSSVGIANIDVDITSGDSAILFKITNTSQYKLNVMTMMALFFDENNKLRHAEEVYFSGAEDIKKGESSVNKTSCNGSQEACSAAIKNGRVELYFEALHAIAGE